MQLTLGHLFFLFIISFTHPLLLSVSLTCAFKAVLFHLAKLEVNNALDKAAKELAKLAAKLELEEIMSHRSPGNENEEEDDNTDGWVNEKALLSDEECKGLDESVKPV
jgi:hypothetical protein